MPEQFRVAVAGNLAVSVVTFADLGPVRSPYCITMVDVCDLNLDMMQEGWYGQNSDALEATVAGSSFAQVQDAWCYTVWKLPLVNFKELQNGQNNVVDKAKPRSFCFLCMVQATCKLAGKCSPEQQMQDPEPGCVVDHWKDVSQGDR